MRQMFKDRIPKEIQKEVDILSKVNYLFGSRYMDFAHFESPGIFENTDWDFAIPYSPEESFFAELNGWKLKDTDSYKDMLHVYTWEKYINDYKVQVCSKNNLALFINTYYSLSGEFYWTYLHKSSEFCIDKSLQKDFFNQFYILKEF